jgi:hypothetical protein
VLIRGFAPVSSPELGSVHKRRQVQIARRPVRIIQFVNQNPKSLIGKAVCHRTQRYWGKALNGIPANPGEQPPRIFR